MQSYDVIVIGAGIGGLATAALLATRGMNVLVLEQHKEVGGCAATFPHQGFQFDSGATLGSGFHQNGPMQWLAQELDLQWPLQELDVAWEYRDGTIVLPLQKNREAILNRFPGSALFWKEQAVVADLLWDVAEKALLRFIRLKRTLFHEVPLFSA